MEKLNNFTLDIITLYKNRRLCNYINRATPAHNDHKGSGCYDHRGPQLYKQ